MSKGKGKIKMKCTDGYLYHGNLVNMNKYNIEVEGVNVSFESNLVPGNNNLSREPIKGPVVFERNNIVWFIITE